MRLTVPLFVVKRSYRATTNTGIPSALNTSLSGVDRPISVLAVGIASLILCGAQPEAASLQHIADHVEVVSYNMASSVRPRLSSILEPDHSCGVWH